MLDFISNSIDGEEALSFNDIGEYKNYIFGDDANQYLNERFVSQDGVNVITPANVEAVLAIQENNLLVGYDNAYHEIECLSYFDANERIMSALNLSKKDFVMMLNQEDSIGFRDTSIGRVFSVRKVEGETFSELRDKTLDIVNTKLLGDGAIGRESVSTFNVSDDLMFVVDELSVVNSIKEINKRMVEKKTTLSSVLNAYNGNEEEIGQEYNAFNIVFSGNESFSEKIKEEFEIFKFVNDEPMSEYESVYGGFSNSVNKPLSLFVEEYTGMKEEVSKLLKARKFTDNREINSKGIDVIVVDGDTLFSLGSKNNEGVYISYQEDNDSLSNEVASVLLEKGKAYSIDSIVMKNPKWIDIWQFSEVNKEKEDDEFFPC